MTRFAFTQVDVFTDTAAARQSARGRPRRRRARRRARCRPSRAGPTSARRRSCSRPPTPTPTTACASSRPAASCRSPAIRRSAAATPGSSAAAGRSRAGSVVQQCGVGLVRIQLEAPRAAFAAPPLTRGGGRAATTSPPCSPRSALGRERLRRGAVARQRPALARRCCSTPPRRCSRSSPTAALMKRFATVGVVGPHPAGGACAFEVRGFVGTTVARTRIRSPAASTPASPNG